ncbi:MAG: hypothetical protein VX498_08150 [Myxococcota bacterium]|nr:hypothetical protein [Myxococcota bacterium]
MSAIVTFGDYSLIQIDRLGGERTELLGEPIPRFYAEPALRSYFLESSFGRADLVRLWSSLYGSSSSPGNLEEAFRAVFAFVGDSPVSGSPFVLFRRPEAGAPAAVAPEGTEPRSPEPPAESSTTWFEVLVVDEVGEAVPGIEIEFDAGSASGSVTTDGAGVARLEGSEVNLATAWVPDVEAALSVLEPRWAAERSGETPTGSKVFPGHLIAPFRRRSLVHKRQYTFVLHAPLLEIAAESLSFQGNHGSMKVNPDDWSAEGEDHPSPEWKRGEGDARPVSYTKGETPKAEVELSAIEERGPVLPVFLGGKQGSYAFGGDGLVRGSDSKVTIEATEALPDRVMVVKGAIDWAAEVQGNRYPAGRTEGSKIFVTLGTPETTSDNGAAITEKRMATSVELVSRARSTDPHTVVDYLMDRFNRYTLVKDPSVPAKFNQPTYYPSRDRAGSTAADGAAGCGAWPVADYIRAGAECQAIVRFTQNVIKQVGCPGEADFVLVWSEPRVENGNRALESAGRGGLNGYPSETKDGVRRYACLVDTRPEEGKIYDIEQLWLDRDAGRINPHYMGLNNFEACLRFEHGGVKKYYGGGAGVYDSPEEVITAFQALCWVSFTDEHGRRHVAPTGNRGARIEEIVKRYR